MAGVPSSHIRRRTGSIMARIAPDVLRAMITCSPMETPWASSGSSGSRRGADARTAHQVVVVDDDEQLRALPPVAAAHPLGGDLLAGHPAVHRHGGWPPARGACRR